MNKTQLLNSKGKMITASGKVFDLMNPDINLIDINDIARALSRLYRWNGHADITVAQHSCMAAWYVSEEIQPHMLLHDAEEAYWGDIIRPIKYLYPEIEKEMTKLRKLIFKRFGLKYIYNKEMKEADNMCLMHEYEHVLKGEMVGRLAHHKWSIEMSESMFLTHCEYYNIKN